MAVETMPKQLTLNVGGATVDRSEIAGFGFRAGAKALDGELKKGSDVTITMRCRVTAVKVKDEYDGHGNVSVTVREHTLVATDPPEVEAVDARAWRERNEPDENGAGPAE
jgi:hypothetical protein